MPPDIARRVLSVLRRHAGRRREPNRRCRAERRARLRRLLGRLIRLDARTLAAVTAGHALISYAGLALAGEDALVATPGAFAYFYLVSASTVGYGDMTPLTGAGRALCVLFVIPGAIAIFGAALARLMSFVHAYLRSLMTGLGDYADATGHCLIMGYRPGATEQLVDEIADPGESGTTILLAEIDAVPVTLRSDPRIRFVAAQMPPAPEDLRRAGLARAVHVAILAACDSEAMAAALACTHERPMAHIAVFVDTPATAALLSAQAPQLEIVRATAPRQMAQVLGNPGTSEVYEKLASRRDGATLNSAVLPDLRAPVPIGALSQLALDAFSGSLVGYRDRETGASVLALSPDHALEGGTRIYMISPRTVSDRTLAAALAACGID